jgi:hypothetical protein
MLLNVVANMCGSTAAQSPQGLLPVQYKKENRR